MLSESELERVVGALPFARDDARIQQMLLRHASLHRIAAGTDVFNEGDQCGAIAILMSGTVRVYKIGETGREITLYRFGDGESCILTANCILSQQQFPAIATVERDAEALMIGASDFREWVDTFPPWRAYVFDLLSRRLSTVMAIVDEVAFRRMDVRIAALLLQRMRGAGPIKLTHQEIAAELGTSREVVSRMLEAFAAENLIETGRGTVTVHDVERLSQRANH